MRGEDEAELSVGPVDEREKEPDQDAHRSEGGEGRVPEVAGRDRECDRDPNGNEEVTCPPTRRLVCGQHRTDPRSRSADEEGHEEEPDQARRRHRREEHRRAVENGANEERHQLGEDDPRPSLVADPLPVEQRQHAGRERPRQDGERPDEPHRVHPGRGDDGPACSAKTGRKPFEVILGDPVAAEAHERSALPAGGLQRRRGSLRNSGLFEESHRALPPKVRST